MWASLDHASHPLNVVPPHARKLEKLIQQYGERRVAIAWLLYVREDPPKYNLYPVEVVAKGH